MACLAFSNMHCFFFFALVRAKGSRSATAPQRSTVQRSTVQRWDSDTKKNSNNSLRLCLKAANTSSCLSGVDLFVNMFVSHGFGFLPSFLFIINSLFLVPVLSTLFFQLCALLSSPAVLIYLQEVKHLYVSHLFSLVTHFLSSLHRQLFHGAKIPSANGP